RASVVAPRTTYTVRLAWVKGPSSVKPDASAVSGACADCPVAWRGMTRPGAIHAMPSAPSAATVDQRTHFPYDTRCEAMVFSFMDRTPPLEKLAGGLAAVVYRPRR